MDNIEALLKERGLTKSAFSDLLGIKKQNLNGLMKNPTLETLKRFASVLRVDTWQLFVSPEEVSKEQGTGLRCPNCGAKLELKKTED
ncbi:helix-turn-helix domain-containing protein [Paraprevotella xylaniphila]|uniref:helix-turn-helix domain-containing protein n=1 Tax=Paraprevotella xylaniphila TaxID=454155 RepID=UPI0024A9DEE3|nr:helix-turn-helix transcriptional regulator [Paraprevotella xylaniphila]